MSRCGRDEDEREADPRYQVRTRGRGHKTETRVFAREIHETFCVDRRCKFYGKPAAQGICHSTLGWRRTRELERAERSADELLRETRIIGRAMTRRRYIQYLESQVACDWMNGEFLLDELVKLRAENAELRLRTRKRGRRRTR